MYCFYFTINDHISFIVVGFLREHAAVTQVQMDPGSNGPEREQQPLKCPGTIMKRHIGVPLMWANKTWKGVIKSWLNRWSISLMGRLTNEGFGSLLRPKHPRFYRVSFVPEALLNDIQCVGLFNSVCLSVRRRIRHSGSSVAASSWVL